MKKHSSNRILIIGLIALVLVTVYLLVDRKRLIQKVPPGKEIAANHKEASTASNASTTQLTGCDISHWDGAIDWPALKGGGINFVFVKATQGTTYIDPDFE